MFKRYEMVMVPNQPKELRDGMLCRSAADEADENLFYFLGSEGEPEGPHEPVVPFIVSKDLSDGAEKGVLYFFRFGDGGCCIAYPEELFDQSDVVSAQQVIVSPENIGLVEHEGGRREIGLEEINSIMGNGGWCYVDIDDEFTAPEKFEYVPWGESVPEVRLYEGKCLIRA